MRLRLTLLTGLSFAQIFLLSPMLKADMQFVPAVLIVLHSQTDSTAQSGDQPQRVETDVAIQNLVKKVDPIIPPLAKQAGIGGTVVLEVGIAIDGKVASVKVLSGHPMLAPACIEAVQKWEYKPFMRDGQPIAVVSKVELTLGSPVRTAADTEAMLEKLGVKPSPAPGKKARVEAAKQSEKDASLPPLQRLTHSVERFEAAEAGRETGLTPQEMEKLLEQTTTEMKAYLDAHPDDVDAIILSARLAHIQGAHEQVTVSGGGQQATDQLEQEAKQTRAWADALAGRLDHALALEPGRADAYYWKARIYGITQPVLRDNKFVHVPIDLQESIRDCRRATELAPDNVPYHEALAQYLIMDGKFDDAAEAMHTVAGGQHIISLLLADRKALPVPDGAIPAGAEGFAEMEMERGRIHDYPMLRVQTYLLQIPASDVVAFYQKRFSGLQFFELKGGSWKNKDMETHAWGQLLRSSGSGLQPLTSKRDFENLAKKESLPDGLVLNLMETRRKSPQAKDFLGIPVGEVYCFLTVVNGRAASTH
jgi:TonB family protein